MRQIRILITSLILSINQIHTDPPPPPPLTGELASQSLEQLLQLFNKNSSTALNSALSLLKTTAAKKTLAVSTTSTSGTNSSKSGAVTTTNSVDAIAQMLDNPNISTTAKANLTFTTHTNADGSAKKITAKSQYSISPAVSALNKSFVSNFTGSNEIALPELTFSTPAITQAYKEFAQALKNTPSFLPTFKKIHTVALHEIYLYLISIYATLNLMHIDDFKTYVILENTFGLNKKTLIISHLVNMIQAQLTQTLQELLPGMPKEVAIRAGMTAMMNQGAANLDMFVLDMEKAALALIGIDPLSAQQISSIIKALESDKNAQAIAANQDIDQQEYKDALAVIKTSQEKFVQQLTSNQADALIEALLTLSAGTPNAQKIKAVQNIIKSLNDPKNALLISAQDLYFFRDIIEQITYGVPFSTISEAFTSLSTKVSAGNSQSLSAAESTCLQSVLSYILKTSEENISATIEYAFQKLAELNLQYETLTTSQKIDLQQTMSLFIKDNPPIITKLKKPTRLLLARAFEVFSKNPPQELPKNSDVYTSIGKKLLDDAVTNATLTTQEIASFIQGCKYLAAFTPQKDIEKLFSSQDQTILSQAFDLIDTTDIEKNPFKNLPSTTCTGIYQALIKLDSIVQARFVNHDTQASLFEGVIQEDEATIESILLSLSITDYESLNNLYEYIRANPTTSFAQAETRFKDKKFSPIQICKTIFLPSTELTKLSYFDIINSLKKSQNGDQSIIQQIIKTLSSNDLAIYQTIADNLKSLQFDFEKLSQEQTKLLLSVFVPLENSLNESVDPQADSAISQLLQTTAILIGQTHSFNTMKGSFLWALKKYLIFFNLYTASLETYTTNNYLGFVAFSNDAKSVSQSLKSSTIQTLNPPLFLYDEATLRSIKMLPQLSKLIENTEKVPYPTFAIEQALNETTINPNDGLEYSNTVSMAQGAFIYKKFFFIDTTQQANGTNSGSLDTSNFEELTTDRAKKITWLKKISVPTSTDQNKSIKNYDHMYVTTNQPADASGFYMNIPIFNADITDPRKLQIRLFEQKIIAQPEWLNHSGFEKNVPGVATFVRGCLGDFTSLLDLGVFDPCLTVVFKAALAVSTESDSFNDLKKKDPNFIQQTNECGTYLQNKSIELQKRQQTTTVTNLKKSTAGGSVTMPGAA